MTTLVAFMAAVVAVQAERSDQTTFRARTELVRLDVVVVDADGHALHGLSAADFTVRDRGRVQQIAQVEEISHEAAGSGSLPPNVKQDVADNAASRADRLIVLVLDDLHFQKKTDDVKAMARRVVTSIGTGASLALITTSGTFGIEPTVDRSLLLGEIDRFLDRFDPEGRRLAPGAQMPKPAPIRNALGEVVAERGPHDPSRFFGDMVTYRTLQDVAKKIQADGDRRNALVWISGGMNPQIAAPGGPSLSPFDPRVAAEQAQAGLIEALQKSNVAAYGITTREFSSNLLQTVADRTGGFVMEASDFDRDLSRFVDDLDHYYLLGFYPTDAEGRGFHDVQVTVNRPGLTVRYRRGYASGARPPLPRNAGRLSRLSEGVLPVADLPLRMFAAPLPAANRHAAPTAIALEVRVPRALLADADGFLRDTLRYEVWAIDLHRKRAVKNVAREAELVLDKSEAAADPADPVVYQIHAVLPLAPGRYQLRASAASSKAGRAGSVFLETDVPDYAAGVVSIAPVAVSYADEQPLPVVRGSPGLGLIPVRLTLDRSFEPTARLRLTTDIVQRVRTDADVTVDLLTAAGDRARRWLDKHLAPGDSRALEIVLDLAGLAPGAYLLRVTAKAGNTTATRDVPLVVR